MTLDIEWYGHSCFRIKTAGRTVVTDPYDLPGMTLPSLSADVLTLSHGHPGHAAVKAVTGDPFIIDGPGEYEVGGIFVIGVLTAHDDEDGRKRGPNTVYCITSEGLTVCHLGDLGHLPTQAQLEAMGPIDVVMIPVGGGTSLTAAAASEVVGLLDPSLVVPMHFQSPGRPALDPVDRFLMEMGAEDPIRDTVLRVAPNRLPDTPQVVLLTPLAGL